MMGDLRIVSVYSFRGTLCLSGSHFKGKIDLNAVTSPPPAIPYHDKINHRKFKSNTIKLTIFIIAFCSQLQQLFLSNIVIRWKKAILETQICERVISLSHRTNLTTESIRFHATGHTSLFIDLSNGDLHGGVILGGDDVVGDGTFSWNVNINNFPCVVLHGDGSSVLGFTL